jgi:solute:Na+ symporter, SSS family
MSGLDIAIVAAYLIGLFAWAVYIGIRETAEDFLVFSRKAPFLLVVFSVISTWVGVGTTLATAASGYRTGISLGLTAACGGIAGALSAAWVAPQLKQFGDKYGAHTIGDFFGARYSRHSRFASSVLILFVYIVLTAAQFVGMAALLQVWTEQSFRIVVGFAAVSTILYTAFAGIKSDFYTDVVHFVLMTVVLFVILLPVTLGNIGGFTGLSHLPASYFDPFAYGGVSFFVGGLIFGAGSVFVMMELWQRIYASSSPKNARWALISSISVIVLFYAVATLLGMIARILLPDLQDADQAIFRLMVLYLPNGVLGLAVAAFLAIFISTLNSTIMVSSATLTKDVYYAFIDRGRRTNMLFAARIATFVCGVAGLLVAFAIPDIVVLSVNGMFLLLVLLPAIIGGLFFKTITSKAASLSIMSGILVTTCFFFIEPNTAFVPGFVTSLLVLIVASCLTRNSESEDLTIVDIWRK